MPIWHGSDEPPQYPCPACGFVVFPEPPGSYFICPICTWEDDESQLRHPDDSGANRESLIEYQTVWIAKLPLDIQFHNGYWRDTTWRPIREGEYIDPHKGQAGYEAPPYYWRDVSGQGGDAEG